MYIYIIFFYEFILKEITESTKLGKRIPVPISLSNIIYSFNHSFNLTDIDILTLC